LCAGCDLAVNGKVGEKSLDFGLAGVGQVAGAAVTNESLDPGDVGSFSPQSFVPQSQFSAGLLEEWRLTRVDSADEVPFVAKS